MGFRISDATIFLNAVRSARLNRFGLSELQAQLATGKRINSLGDDPTDAARILRLRRLDERLAQFDRNIDAARRRLEPTEAALQTVTENLTRLRELAVSADIENATQRAGIQTEVEQIFDELIRVSNTRFADGTLFSGFRTDQLAFTKVNDFVAGVVSALDPGATYNGDANEIEIQIGESATIVASAHGAEIFEGDADNNGVVDAGRVNIFDVVRDLRNRLLDPVGVGPPTDVTDELDLAIGQVLEVRGRIGGRLNRLDAVESQLQALNISLESERSAIEDLDIVEAATALASRENTYQASLAVTARVIQPSLLNFLS